MELVFRTRTLRPFFNTALLRESMFSFRNRSPCRWAAPAYRLSDATSWCAGALHRWGASRGRERRTARARQASSAATYRDEVAAHAQRRKLVDDAGNLVTRVALVAERVQQSHADLVVLRYLGVVQDAVDTLVWRTHPTSLWAASGPAPLLARPQSHAAAARPGLDARHSHA